MLIWLPVSEVGSFGSRIFWTMKLPIQGEAIAPTQETDFMKPSAVARMCVG